jgi:phosphoglycerate kinase
VSRKHFHKEEEKNDPASSQSWQNRRHLGQRAFSAAHAPRLDRGLGHKLPAYAGRTMQAELDALGKALDAPTGL